MQTIILHKKEAQGVYELKLSLWHLWLQHPALKIFVLVMMTFCLGAGLLHWSSRWVDEQNNQHENSRLAHETVLRLQSYQKIYDALPAVSKADIAILVDARVPLRIMSNQLRKDEASNGDASMNMNTAQIIDDYIAQWPDGYYLMGAKTKVLLTNVPIAQCIQISPDAEEHRGNLGDYIQSHRSMDVTQPFCYIHQWDDATPSIFTHREKSDRETPIAAIILPEHLQRKFAEQPQ